MGIFKNKFLIKLIAFICIFLTLINFAGSSKVYALDSEKDTEVWGGVLIKPITKLMVSIGDAIMEILHESVQSQKATFIRIGGESWWEELWIKIASVVVAILAFATIYIVLGACSGFAPVIAAAVSKMSFVGAMASFEFSISTFGVVVAGARRYHGRYRLLRRGAPRCNIFASVFNKCTGNLCGQDSFI